MWPEGEDTTELCGCVSRWTMLLSLFNLTTFRFQNPGTDFKEAAHPASPDEGHFPLSFLNPPISILETHGSTIKRGKKESEILPCGRKMERGVLEK